MAGPHGNCAFSSVQLIQDEIKQLVRLQSSTRGAGRSRGLPAQLTDTFSSLPSPMGMRSEVFEEQESIVSQLRSSEGETQPEASDVQQECVGSEASMNSGYGTLSTSELHPAQPSDSRGTDCMEHPPHGAGLQGDAGVDSVQNKRELLAKKAEENRSSGRNDVLAFPAEFEYKADEDQRGKKAR